MRSAARRPPRLAAYLLETLLPVESRDVVVGDLAEAHDRWASHGGFVAWLLYWRETIAAILQLQVLPDLASAFTPYQWESRTQAVLSDLRRATRTLARARGFTFLCVGTLATGIGSSAAIFSVVNPVLLRSLPYPNADRLLMVYERERGGAPSHTGYLTYLDLRRDAQTLEHAAVFAYWQSTVFGDQDAERLNGQVVTWEYFRTLGVQPALGRDFGVGDDTPDSRNVVILSHGLWSRRFGGDSSIIGRTIDIDGVDRRVVGVMPPTFENVLVPEAVIWRPLGYATFQSWACRACRHLQMVARVREGATGRQVDRELGGLMTRIAAEHPKEYASAGAMTMGVQDRVTRDARPILFTLFGAVLLVLAIAVANVLSLQLVRAARRREEFAVRAALGAGRAVIARQLVAEGLVLALLGAVAGIGVATLLVPSLVAQLPENMPRLAAVRLDWSALAFVGAIALAIGVVAGLAPALDAGRARLFDTLHGSSRALTGARHRLRATLVVTEIALALMLTIGAALLGRSLLRLLVVNPGFDPANLVTMQVQASGSAYRDQRAVLAHHDRVREAVRAVPGVLDVALTSQLPLGGNFDRYGIHARDKPLENLERAPSADRYTVSADFLRAMRIPVVRGRGFTDAEAADSTAQVAIVSDALARRLWLGEDPVGKYIRLGAPDGPWKEVIGVAGNVRHTGLHASVTQQVYIPERQWYWADDVVTLVARMRDDSGRSVSAISAAVRGVDSLQPIAKIATMHQVIARSTSQRRMGLLLFGVFSGIALLLASAGVYGILVGSVEERTREIGLRSAMGATPARIVALVLSQAGRLAVVGIALGAAGALALSRYLRSLLYGVEPTDPAMLALAVATVIAVSLTACLVPARRAVRVDPVTALRAD